MTDKSSEYPRIIYQHEDIDPSLAASYLEHAAAVDIVTDDDRDWFDANPDRSYRLRPISAAERAAAQQGLPVYGCSSYVLVRQVKPGLRARLMFDAHPFHHPENFSDDACAMLLDQIKNKEPRVTGILKTFSTT